MNRYLTFFLICLVVFMFAVGQVTASPAPLMKNELNIAGLTFYDSIDKVRATIGEPRFLWKKHYPGPGYTLHRYELPGMQIDLNDSFNICGVYVYTASYPTTRGIKCGDTLQQVEDTYGITKRKYYSTDYDGKKYLILNYPAKNAMAYYLMFKIEPDTQVVKMITLGIDE